MNFDLHTIVDPKLLIQTLGYAGLFFAVFSENALFFGVIFPGDSLLFTAGFLSAQGYLNFPVILIGCFVCAVVGDSVGYYIGKKLGPKIFTKEDSFFFHKKHVLRAEKFLEAHGGKTIILARFIPYVRTFAPMLAGVGNMPYKSFLFFNIIGGFIWSVGFLSAGYFLSKLIPGFDKYMVWVVAGIFVVSFIPVFVGLAKAWFGRNT